MLRRPFAMLPLALAGCGFELRRAPELPFGRIALSGFDARSPLAGELAAQLAGSAKVVAAGDRPEVVLHALADRREKSVVASTSAGQVREVQLRVRFEYRLTSASGRELVAPAAIVLARDMSYAETFALAKEQEEARIYSAMQTEVVMQVMRRLGQVRRG